MERPETTTATQGLNDLGPLTHSQRYVIGYLARWGSMYGKPKTMETLRARGLVEPCGRYGLFTQWRLTTRGKELERYFL